MAMERRRHRLLSTLFIALEKHGYTAKVDERGRPTVEIARQPTTVIIKEKYRQVRRPLTGEEKKRGFNPKKPWKPEMQPTGLLQLSIEPRLHPTLRQSWIDAADQPLEQQVRQRQQLERNRLRGFLELASRWRQVEDARLFLAALASCTAETPAQAVGDLSLDEWIAWARERLTRHDPLEAGAATVFRVH